MQHIIVCHMHPVKSGKSYFLSRDVSEVSNLITQTITNADQILIHKSDKYKRVYKKKFPYQTGIHGKNGNSCYGVIAVKKTTDNRLITAYPVLSWQLSFVLYFGQCITICGPNFTTIWGEEELFLKCLNHWISQKILHLFIFEAKYKSFLIYKSKVQVTAITALKFTCCSSLSVSYQQNCFILRTVHNYLWTKVPTHLCNRIKLLLSLVQMFLLCKTRSTLLSPLLSLSSVETTDWGIEMAVLERVAERLLRSSFVDLGTGTLGSSMYLLYLLMWCLSFINTRVKDYL